MFGKPEDFTDSIEKQDKSINMLQLKNGNYFFTLIFEK